MFADEFRSLICANNLQPKQGITVIITVILCNGSILLQILRIFSPRLLVGIIRESSKFSLMGKDII